MATKTSAAQVKGLFDSISVDSNAPAGEQVDHLNDIVKGLQNYKAWAESRGALFEQKRKNARKGYEHRGTVLKTNNKQAVYRRGESDDTDVFAGKYGLYGLLEPRYNFLHLLNIVEESDALQWCIAAMVQGCDGNGHIFEFLGDRKAEKDKPEEQSAELRLRCFFDEVNDDGSFVNARERWRYDLESTGNAAFEIVRDLVGDVCQIWHLPITYCRMSPPETDPIEVTWWTRRNGQPEQLKRYAAFRKYARYLPYQGYKITWFKEFGDPRIMDKRTGEYWQEGMAEIPPEHRASELWWFKIPFKNLDYGAPRWIGALTVIKGRILANFVNFDLFNNQGVPPLLIVAAGGHFTDGTLDEIENTLESWRDPAKFNRVCLMEIEQNEVGFGDTSQNKVTVTIERLRDARAEDYMFGNFLKYSGQIIGQCWRMAQLLLGSSEDYSLASAYAAQQTVEQQVFAPERRRFDEQLMLKVVRREFRIWNWALKSMGPQITGSDELAKIFGQITRGGGASMNDLTEFLNKYAGTNIKLSENKLMKVPAMIIQSLARLGRISIDDEGELVLLTPEQAQGMVGLAGDEELEGEDQELIAQTGGGGGRTARPSAGSVGGGPNFNGEGTGPTKSFSKGLHRHPEYSNFLEALRDVSRAEFQKSNYKANQARHPGHGRWVPKLTDPNLQVWQDRHSHMDTDQVIKLGRGGEGTYAEDDQGHDVMNPTDTDTPVFEGKREIGPLTNEQTGGVFAGASYEGQGGVFDRILKSGDHGKTE